MYATQGQEFWYVAYWVFLSVLCREITMPHHPGILFFFTVYCFVNKTEQFGPFSR